MSSFISVSFANAEEQNLKWQGISYTVPEGWTKTGKNFNGSVNSRAYVIKNNDDNDTREVMVAMLDTTGVKHGLRENTVSKIVHAYMEGLIVAWGGELLEENNLPGTVCAKGKATTFKTKFGNQHFDYNVCTLNAIDFGKFLFILTWNRDGKPMNTEEMEDAFRRGEINEFEWLEEMQQKPRKPI